MPRLAAWARPFALLALWQTPAIYAAPPVKKPTAEAATTQTNSPSWFQRNFGLAGQPKPTARASAGFAPNGRPLYTTVAAEPKPTPTPTSSKTTVSSKTDAMTPPPMTAIEDSDAKTLQQQQSDFLRRMEVVNRFKEIALMNGDEAAIKQAEALEQQAMDVYQQKTAHLSVARLRAGETASPLDKSIGEGLAANPLTSPTQPRGTERTRTASIKEVQP